MIVVTRLYVLPGACSLVRHIALETAAQQCGGEPRSWEVVVFQRGHNHDRDYAAVNPHGTCLGYLIGDTAAFADLLVFGRCGSRL